MPRRKPKPNPREMTIIAIDPGLKGAISILQADVVRAEPLPVAGKDLDLPALASTIIEVAPALAVVEKVHSMPGQGVASMFKFGKGYGSLLGILAALGVPTELVTPQTWKRSVLKGTAKDKAAAIDYCRRVFPNVPLVPPGCRKPHDGMADALALLEYARRHLATSATPPPVPPNHKTIEAILQLMQSPVIMGISRRSGVPHEAMAAALDRGERLSELMSNL